jgi:signal transduction histidine kinase
MSDTEDPEIGALLRMSALLGPDWHADLEEILHTDSDILGVERVNYWRLRDNPPAMVCELGYAATGQRLDRGYVLRQAEAPRYFGEIRQANVLAIEDAQHDLRSRDLGEYLETHDVRALLDVPIRIGDGSVGILCHEQVGRPRQWSAREKQFALSVGHILSARLEARARSRAEESERRAALLVDVLSALGKEFGAGPAADLAVSRALPMLGDMAALVSFEDTGISNIAYAHLTAEGRGLLEQIARRYPPRLEGPGFIAFAVRKRESIVLPRVTWEAVAPYGVDAGVFGLIQALGVRSLMTVLLSVREQLRGAMVFGSAGRPYDVNDLFFAEAYAQQVGAALENARLYQQARSAIRARDQFLTMASHELRTPLATLSLSAQALSNGMPSGAPLARLSRRISRQVDRLSRLANRLLDASELAAHGMSIHRESLDLAELVRHVAQSFEERASAAGSRLQLSADEVVEGDFDTIRIEQAVSNLLDNAVKFGMGTPIEVSVRARDGQAVVCVRDRGLGIPPQEQGRVFGRYEVGKAGLAIGGLGLGLHLVYEIAEAHGGRVRLESQPPAGTTVWLELPLGRPPALAPPPGPARAPDLALR